MNVDTSFIIDKLKSPEYDFLKTNECLGSNIILLAVGGSYAYGTNVETSDIDIRGIATQTKRDILLGEDFQQVLNTRTDTVVYSLRKFVRLLCRGNVPLMELLGLNHEHYIYLTSIGRYLLDNKQMFLSKQIIRSFKGFIFSETKEVNTLCSKAPYNDAALVAKLSKHMMHLIRLHCMCFDILKEHRIQTYREKEHDLLMDIRHGKYIEDYQGQCKFTKPFNEMIEQFEAKFNELSNATTLPDNVNMDQINNFLIGVNEYVVLNH